MNELGRLTEMACDELAKLRERCDKKMLGLRIRRLREKLGAAELSPSNHHLVGRLFLSPDIVGTPAADVVSRIINRAFNDNGDGDVRLVFEAECLKVMGLGSKPIAHICSDFGHSTEFFELTHDNMKNIPSLTGFSRYETANLIIDDLFAKFRPLIPA